MDRGDKAIKGSILSPFTGGRDHSFKRYFDFLDSVPPTKFFAKENPAPLSKEGTRYIFKGDGPLVKKGDWDDFN